MKRTTCKVLIAALGFPVAFALFEVAMTIMIGSPIGIWDEKRIACTCVYTFCYVVASIFLWVESEI